MKQLRNLKSSTYLQRRVAPIVILILGISILQWHAIAFWVSTVGNNTGWAWPLLLEVTSLWLWSFRRLNMGILGLATTLVLLAGPLYQVGSPIIRELEQIGLEQGTSQIQTTDLRTEIELLAMSLNTYRSNSETRLGWYNLITHTEQRLSEAQKELREAVKGNTQLGNRMSWQSWTIIGLQLASIMIFQTLNILAVITLARPKNQTPKLTIKLLQKEVHNRIKAEKTSVIEWCRGNKVNQRHIWMLLNHFKHLQEGKETLTDAKLTQLIGQFITPEMGQRR